MEEATNDPSRQTMDIKVRWKEQTGNKGTLHSCTKFRLNYIEKVVNRKAIFGKYFQISSTTLYFHPKRLQSNDEVNSNMKRQYHKDYFRLLSIELGEQS